MKKFAYIAIFFVFVSCTKETVYQTPQEVIIAGKVLNIDTPDLRLQFMVSRIGVEPLIFEIETDSVGNFITTLETYVPTIVSIDYNTSFGVLVHPNDSVFVEFDGKATERVSVRKTIKFSGDSDKINEEAAKIEELYFSSPLFLDDSTKNRVCKEYDVEQYQKYHDTLTIRYKKLYEKFVAEYSPSKAGKLWAKNFLDFRLVDELAFYPLSHMMHNQLSPEEWDVTPDFYTPVQGLISVQPSMFLCGYWFGGYINRYLYSYVGERTRNEDFVKEYAERNYEGMTPVLMDSLMIDGIIRHTPDELLREMVLTEYLVATFRSNDLTSFENNISVVDEYITHNFLKEPLYEKYHQVKRLNENPLASADAILSSPDSLSVEAILSDIANKNTGKVIYLDTWATWCSPCKSEMPNSKRLMETMKDRDVAFVFVCVDSEDRLWKVSLAEFQIGGQHYFFNEEQSDVFRDLYDVEGIPHYFLYDKGGELVDKGSHLRPNTMKEKIEVLL